eukprot:5378520-Karenia_brevis.AAC.1
MMGRDEFADLQKEFQAAESKWKQAKASRKDGQRYKDAWDAWCNARVRVLMLRHQTGVRAIEKASESGAA